MTEHATIGRGTSAIEWTNATWNPVTGCTRVSPGCAHCYIERTPPFRIAGRRFERVGNEETTGVTLHPERLDQPLRWRKPRMVFVNSLSDLFHEEIPFDYIESVFRVMAEAKQHTFQVLTKRPEIALDVMTRLYDRSEDVVGTGLPAVPWTSIPNVWIGVSIENARCTWRADVLREIPAAVRFISAEPLLGSLFEPRSRANVVADRQASAAAVGAVMECRPDLTPDEASSFIHRFEESLPDKRKQPLDLTGIDWLIAGAESGPGARPMSEEWVRELRDACTERGVAFFYKQDAKNGKKLSTPELDGRRWTEMPDAAR